MRYHVFNLDNVMMVRIKDVMPTKVVENGDVTTLYHNDDIIGYNIFNNHNNYPKGLLKLNKDIHQDILNQTGNKELTLDEKPYIVVGKIISLEKHPDSDKLKVCQVDIGDKVVQIVCGANNVAHGQKVVVALPNAILYNGVWIKKGKLLKVESNGMICSAKELGLAPESQGILVLDDKYQVGEAFFNED